MSQKYQQTLLYPPPTEWFPGPLRSLSGYQLQGAVLNSYLHTYIPLRVLAAVQSQARLEIIYQSDYWSAFVNWVVPLLL